MVTLESSSQSIPRQRKSGVQMFSTMSQDDDMKKINITQQTDASSTTEDEEMLNSGSVHDAEVKRELKQRHIGMIALGGTIGTGLFIGISTPLVDSGPVGSLIAYIFVGTLTYAVTQSLGEMATFIPVTSSFTVFASRFLSPSIGAAVGYMYWFSWAVTFALELSVVGQIVDYWTFAVPIAAWISIFWVILTALNMFPVKFYGEIEFWVATVKVVAIAGFLIYCLCMVCGAGVTGPIGFRYWRHPGPWGDGLTSNGVEISKNKNTGRFLGWFASLINAAFTYQGTELVGITAGEAANPRKTVPRAIKKVVFRILLFYIGSLFFVGLLVPFDDSKLSSDDSYVSSSPFIIAIENSGTKILPDIFNAVILITIISAGNSNIYVGSRILFSLAKTRLAPKIFSCTTKEGVPYVSVLATAIFGALAYMETTQGGQTVFNWLVNITAIAGFWAWLFILISHIRFMQVLKFRGISRDDLPFKANLMPGLAYYAVFCMAIIIVFQGFTAFTPTFNVSDFFAAYISVILFFIIWGAFQLWFKCRWIWKIEDVDIDSNRRDVEKIIWEDPEPKTFWDKFWNVVA